MSKNNYQNQKKRKPRAGKIIKIVCVALARLLLGAGIMSIAKKDDKVNPKNLLISAEYTGKLEETAGGLKIKWGDDGEFRLSGKHESDNTLNDSKTMFPFTTVKLAAGEYVITPNNKDCAVNKFGLYYTLDNEDFFVTEPTTITIT